MCQAYLKWLTSNPILLSQQQASYFHVRPTDQPLAFEVLVSSQNMQRCSLSVNRETATQTITTIGADFLFLCVLYPFINFFVKTERHTLRKSAAWIAFWQNHGQNPCCECYCPARLNFSIYRNVEVAKSPTGVLFDVEQRAPFQNAIFSHVIKYGKP